MDTQWIYLGPEGEGEPKRHKPGVLLSGGTQRTHMLVDSTAIKLNDLSNVVSKGLKYCGGWKTGQQVCVIPLLVLPAWWLQVRETDRKRGRARRRQMKGKGTTGEEGPLEYGEHERQFLHRCKCWMRCHVTEMIPRGSWYIYMQFPAHSWGPERGSMLGPGGS